MKIYPPTTLPFLGPGPLRPVARGGSGRRPGAIRPRPLVPGGGRPAREGVLREGARGLWVARLH